jgi:hypothetical protein
MKNIVSNIFDFINKLKMGKMIKTVMKNKWVLLSLVFLVLFYYLFYSVKEGVTGSAEDPETEEGTDDVPISKKTKGAYDSSINNKIESTEQLITKSEGEAETLKGEINNSIDTIQADLIKIVNRSNAINNKFPETSS